MKQREQASFLLQKAHHDEVLVQEVLNAEHVADEIVGFHCQQALEKLLKALLSLRGVRYRKTHDLRELMDLLNDAGELLPSDLQDIDVLSPYASLFRYEAMPPSASLDRRQALDMVQRLRKWVEAKMGE